jgi:hypothetical protein
LKILKNILSSFNIMPSLYTFVSDFKITLVEIKRNLKPGKDTIGLIKSWLSNSDLKRTRRFKSEARKDRSVNRNG